MDDLQKTSCSAWRITGISPSTWLAFNGKSCHFCVGVATRKLIDETISVQRALKDSPNLPTAPASDLTIPNSVSNV